MSSYGNNPKSQFLRTSSRESVPQALLAAGTDESATLLNVDISQDAQNVKIHFSLLT